MPKIRPLKSKRILYAVQGTGNGHVARARQIIPILQKLGDVDVWLGGTESEIELPQKPTYSALGFVLYYDKAGAVSFWRTIVKNKYLQIIRDIFSAPVAEYDIIINDFEFITAWASMLRGVHCISLSHQAAFHYKECPRPKFKNPIGELILRYYAPARKYLGFHFQCYHSNIYPPVIRDEIRQLKPTNGKHVTVYLPAFDHNKLISIFKAFEDYTFEVFSKFANKDLNHGNVHVKPISNEAFIRSFASSHGIICGAGFESPAEALFLGKRVLVVPINKQYEQYCNAAALKQLGQGVMVLDNLDQSSLYFVGAWLRSEKPTQTDYPDFIADLLTDLISEVPFRDKKRLAKH